MAATVARSLPHVKLVHRGQIDQITHGSLMKERTLLVLSRVDTQLQNVLNNGSSS